MRSKLVIHYLDGRLVKGWSPVLFPTKPTFVFPPDPDDNTERVLVVTNATVDVKLI